MMLKHVTAKRFHDGCRLRILENIRKIKLVFLINLAKFKFRRCVSHLRPTVYLRNRQQLKHSLNVIACVKIQQKHSAILLLKEFL
jgi:hypothetical protein